MTSACGSSVGLSARSSSSVTPVLSAISREVVARRARCRSGGLLSSRVVVRGSPRCRALRRAALAVGRGRRTLRGGLAVLPPRDAITTTRKTIAKTASAAGASSLMGLCWWALMPAPMIPAPSGRPPPRAASSRQPALRRRCVSRQHRPGRVAQALPPPAARPPRRRRRAPRRAIDRETVTSAAARPAGERGREVLDPAALCADSGQQEHGVRHALAQGRQQRWLVAATTAPTSESPCVADAVRAQLVHQRRRGGRAAAALRRARRPGSRPRRDSRCARARTRRRRAARAASTIGSRESRPEQRVGGDRVGAQARRPSPTASSVAPSSAWRVGRRGVRHVAALAVGDHEQAGRPRVRGDVAPAPRQPGPPSRSKQASCSFTPTQAPPAESISARQCAATALAARSAGESPRRPPRAPRAAARPDPGRARAGAGSRAARTASRDAVAEVHRPARPAAVVPRLVGRGG